MYIESQKRKILEEWRLGSCQIYYAHANARVIKRENACTIADTHAGAAGKRTKQLPRICKRVSCNPLSRSLSILGGFLLIALHICSLLNISNATRVSKLTSSKEREWNTGLEHPYLFRVKAPSWILQISTEETKVSLLSTSRSL
jgi:hypothetical protein